MARKIKNVNKVKKSSKDDKAFIKVHKLKIKGVAIEGMTNGLTKGFSPIERPKEFKKKKLNKIGDHVPLKMDDLIGKTS